MGYKLNFDSNGRVLKVENNKKQSHMDIINSFYKNLNTDINIIEFISNMKYDGSIESKRNSYHLYSYDEYYLLSSGLKTKTNFNIILKSEVFYLKQIFNQNFSKNWINMKKLEDFFRNNQLSDIGRFNFFKTNSFLSNPRNELYLLLLDSCYVLSCLGLIKYLVYGREVLFSNFNNKVQKKDHFFNNISYLDHLQSKYLFKNNKFYFTINYKNFRGTIFPYLIEEIDLINELNSEKVYWEVINIDFLINNIDYQNRFFEIYNMIIEANLKNDREKYDYFYSRIRSALEIVMYKYNNLIVDNDGHRKIFRKC